MTITRTGSPGSLIFLGVIFFVVGALMMWTHSKQARFTPVQGIIQSSEIAKKTTTQPGAKTSSYSWYLLVEYEYSVDGQNYKNNRISAKVPMSDAALGQPPSDKLVALSEKFVPGQPVTVYVSPKNPSKSILLHAANYGVWGILIGFLFFAGALYWRRLRAAS